MSTKVNELERPGTASRLPVSRTPVKASPKSAEQRQRRRGAQYFDAILWRLREHTETADGSGCVVGLAGCQPRVGATTVAANVAIRAADHGMAPVLIVDANFQRPRLHRVFKLRKGMGLIDVLAKRATTSETIQSGKIAGLDVLPVGRADLLERSAIDHERLAALMKELRHDYQLVVVDLAAAEDAGHQLLFAQYIDAALLVVRAELVRRNTAVEQFRRLSADGFDVVGAVVTGQRDYLPRWMRRNR